MKRLPETELEVMKAVWKFGEGATRPELEQELSHLNWASTTVNTYLTRLVKKEFLSVEHAPRGNRYTPLVSEEEYQTFDSKAVLDQLYGSPRNFVAALARGGMKKRDMDQLRALLNELEGQNE